MKNVNRIAGLAPESLMCLAGRDAPAVSVVFTPKPPDLYDLDRTR